MFLKTLTITGSKGLIREIAFHKGLNLIVDESKASSETQKSGNNIGKTTILRLINFCLGGDAKSIYEDPEFKKQRSNEMIKDFLIEQQVMVKLVLKEDLGIAKSKEVTLRRNFLPRNKKVQELNGQNYGDDKEYDLALKKILFSFDAEKPTFSQIRAKNIRDDAARLENTIKVLGGFAKEEEYEALYLFWLGVPHPDAEKKRSLLDAKRLEDKLLNRLREEDSESKIEQFLAIIQNEIDILEARKNSFNINDNFANDLAELAKVNTQLNELSATQGQLELRKELMEDSRRELQSDQANVSTDSIAALYEEAKILLPNLQKTYEQTVAFHNRMLMEKVKFITKEVPQIDARLIVTKDKIEKALFAERKLKEKLQKAGIVEELQPIIAALNAKHEQRGKLTEKAAQIKTAKAELSRITAELQALDQAMTANDGLVQVRVKAFNTHFSAISECLYGEKFALTAPQVENSNKHTKFYKLEIESLSGRPGTGKKKGEIAAFDIAYVRFADEAALPCLHFILHDQLEVVDDHQMISLRDEVVHANCQLIVPILRDKLPAELLNPEYQIITLSEKNKLFRV
jgi:uncharacterized protein YydD (DUF2326 family)